MELSVCVTPCQKGKGRKRFRQPETWKRVKKQTLRYKPKDLPRYPNCDHAKNVFSCKELTMRDIQQFHSMLYSTTDKIKQDTFLLKFCDGTTPKRSLRDSHRISIKHKIPTVNGDVKRVCKKAFLGITHFSGDRIERIVANFVRSGQMPKEGRGGDRILEKNDATKLRIKQFIESLPCTESHYSRGRTSRLFLRCDLNFKKLFNLFVEKNPGSDVKLAYFRTYLNKNYNLSFGTPLTDVCSTCLRTKELLKQNNSEEEKIKIMTEQRAHSLRAKAFYDSLKSELESVQIFSFDCQKNLALPKLPDQSAYFSQQINLYNFTIVKGSSKTKITPQTAHSYLWLESEYHKNSNAVASAVHDTLVGNTFPGNIEKIHLFADGCGGQNKNSVMMSMLAYYLGYEAPAHIKSLEITFPIVGHSFLPPDRVFGLIEREIKKQSVIVNRSEYETIIGKFSTIHKLNKDWSIWDWKTVVNDIVKKPAQWHFKFNECKRFIFTKHKGKNNVAVRGEILYKSDYCSDGSIVKRGKHLSGIRPTKVTTGNCLRGNKSSIACLLEKHYGPSWRANPELEFYKIVDSPGEASTHSSETEDLSDNAMPETPLKV